MNKVKCRFANTRCQGGNPYAQQITRKENAGGPHIHPSSAWQNPLTSLSSPLHSSLSSPVATFSSLISPTLNRVMAKPGITGQPKEEDVDMGE
eukprot:8429623-Karenia_brevis.AAC.1